MEICKTVNFYDYWMNKTPLNLILDNWVRQSKKISPVYLRTIRNFF